MRVSILHDQMGNVFGLAASPPDAPIAHLEATGGNSITVIDMAEEMRSLKPIEIPARLAAIVENYKVEVGKAPARLVKK